jgi:hypothetical protein
VSSTPRDVTLGEVWRGLEKLTDSVEGLRADLLNEVDDRMKLHVEKVSGRVSHLERIVYPVIGTFALSVLGVLFGKALTGT